ncbi:MULTISPECIES: hypothetical protein [Halobacteriovorax]|uniref:Uncharacterized protein n=1 Tax=Halobacteriovorax vibrionivorans TaxID=2152716 RepID=A0ABY0IFN8_9BACT|nr:MULTISPECIES: hypothetical protein [Halobacteriovorax]AYF43665.1 hypothetical protein BALOs_0654 [Halobacteriovorax sp. BALOs_7]RZF21771.1 hypothetical protein DAY19_08765 [Halobacteriovorax vibrionivorans]TGD45850.1 hypothetical protein EP118_14245 [Halobacteriovorax sp. Y22]
MSSQGTSNEKLTPNLNPTGLNRLRTIRKSASLKPRKSLLRVKSLRPTRAVLGGSKKTEESEG